MPTSDVNVASKRFSVFRNFSSIDYSTKIHLLFRGKFKKKTIVDYISHQNATSINFRVRFKCLVVINIFVLVTNYAHLR